MAPAGRYYEQANPDLLYRIPVNAKAVLEIGCGAGALGEAYKAINPNATYVGVELMPEPAAQARKVLDHVIEGDISKKEIGQLSIPKKITKVDCLIFGDVLEHLVEPEYVLKKLLPLLKDNGVLLLCIPNVQHWSVLANLLRGEWPQEEQGIFDRTHLRWFTKQSVVNMLITQGLNIKEIHPRIFKPEMASEFITALQPALVNLNLSPQEVLEGSAPLQYVVRATKKEVPNIQINGLMLKPQAGMNDVRMIQPLRSVASMPGVELQLTCGSLNLKQADKSIPKIMIWQRQLLTYEESLDRIQLALKAGYILISEFDDDPDHWPLIRANRNLNFTAMHAVQVSTYPLAEQIRSMNPEVAVFENCLEKVPSIDHTKWDHAGANKPLRVFFGALNRKDDWADWINELNAVLTECPNKLEIEVVHDQEFFDQLKTNKKRFTPTCNYNLYLKLLGECHISLLPLSPTEFNKKKSDLKFIEAAGNQIAAIASPTIYTNTIHDLHTGAICKDGEHLGEILKQWIKDPTRPKDIAANARDWCIKKRLQHSQSAQRLKWYHSLWERKETLTASLLSRVPELNQ